MLAHPPREPAWLSWTWVAVWTLFIYYTITRAREIQALVADSVGREWFSYSVFLVIAAGCVWAVRSLIRSGIQIRRTQGLWLAAVALVFVGWTWHLKKGSPEEALHFVEYGVLAVLLFRAFSHSVRDPAVYVCCAMVGCGLGTVDEIIQWITPRRYFDYRDILLNVSACALVLAGIGKGLCPAYIRSGFTRRSVFQACVMGWLALGLLMLCLFNTPGARNAYEDRFPWISDVLRHTKSMTEFGYLYDDPDYGLFRSRLTLETLRSQDEERAAEAGSILDKYHDRKLYADFLERYPEFVDPFLHEVRVHLHRRDHYRYRAVELRDKDPDSARYHSTVAYCENGLVERYWPRTMSNTLFRLKPATVAGLKADRDPGLAYESAVSAGLITWSTPRKMLGWGGLVFLLWTAGWGYVYCRNAGPPDTPVDS